MIRRDFKAWLLLTPLFLFAAGCAVGPDFARPDPPDAAGYTYGGGPAETVQAGGKTQRFEMGALLAEEWWRLFNSAELDSMVKAAIEENWNLKSAVARLKQSQQSLYAGYGVFFPQADGKFSATRQKFSFAQFGASPGATPFGATSPIFNLLTLSGTVSYVLDVFGGQRRNVENLSAQVDYQNATVLAACLTLSGNVVNAAVANAGYRAEMEATEEMIRYQREQVRITENQVKAGTAPYSAVLSLRSQLAATEATLPPLAQSLNQTEHLLASLTGRTPGEWAPPPLDLEAITLPAELPVALPSELVRRRPDILVAEAQLHSASASIGVATAAMFPSITLSAGWGQNSTSTGTLFASDGNFWNLGAALTQPIFHGGTLWFQRKAAIEGYNSALAAYRQTVVAGFQQVADSLRAVEHDAEALKAHSEALAAADYSLRLMKVNYEAGLVNYLQVLTAETQYRQAKLGYIQAKTLRLQDTTALFVALGGGWGKDSE